MRKRETLNTLAANEFMARVQPNDMRKLGADRRMSDASATSGVSLAGCVWRRFALELARLQ